MTLLRKIGSALCLGLLVATTAAAARHGDASVNASLGDASVDTGQQTEFRINVVNGSADPAPAAPTVPGLNIAYMGQESSSQFNFNGSFSQSTTTSYLFSIDTTKPGRFVIPGQDIKVDGAILRTLPLTLTVLGSGVAGGGGNGQPAQPFAELIVPRKTAYLGESIPIELHACYPQGSRHNADPDPILNGDGFSAQKFTAPVQSQQGLRDGRYIVDTYKSAIAGLKLGQLTVGPIQIQPVVQVMAPRQRRQRFNDPFDSLLGQPFDPFGFAPPRQIHLEGEAVPLEIVPLPEAGKPPNFSGAIGQFKLQAEAVPSQAQPGDPITVRLHVTGQGNFDRIAPPVLADETGLRTYPATSKFKADDEVNLSGEKTYEQVVIANGPRQSLPGYHFNYFDPGTGKYVVLDTPPLPVKVEGAPLATPAPTVVASASAASSVPPAATPAIVSAPEDILYIRTDAENPRGPAAFLPLYRQPVFWWSQAGLLGVALALGGVTWTRIRTVDERRQRQARWEKERGELQRNVKSEGVGRRDFYRAAARLAQMSASPAGAPSAENISAQEISRGRSLDDSTAQSLREIFERHAESAYSGGAVAETPVPAPERAGVLAALEKLQRS